MDSSVEGERVADGELAVQGQLLHDATCDSRRILKKKIFFKASQAYLWHVSHHPAWHAVARERRRLSQHTDVTPRDAQSSHDAFQHGGLAAAAGAQEAVAARIEIKQPKMSHL